MNQNISVFNGKVILSVAILTVAPFTSLPAHAILEKTTLTNQQLSAQTALAKQDSEKQFAKDDKKPEREIEKKEDHDREDGREHEDVKLPKSVSESVLQDLSKQAGVQATQLQIVQVQRQTWSDGCLGLGKSDASCTQAVVPGWLVVVARNQQRWVYRANESGSIVGLDKAATQTLMESSTEQTATEGQVTVRQTQSSTSQSTQSAARVTGQQSAIAQRQAQASQASLVSFQDVSSTYWASSFITELAQMKIVEGFPDGNFRPEASVTKAEFAAMLRKAFEKTKIRDAISLRDVSSNYWGYNAIEETYEMGFLGLSGNKEFHPGQRLSRQDVLEAIAKGLNYSTDSSSETVLQVYSDADSIPRNVRSLVAAMTQRGVIVNYPNVKRLNLKKIATRAEACALLHQALVSTGRISSTNSPYVVK